MNCDQATRALSAAADGEPRDEAALEAHLAGCGSCRSFRSSISLIRRELRIAPVTDGIDVTDAVLAAVQRQVDAVPHPRLSAGRRHRLLLRCAVAGLLVAALSGAFLLGRSSRSTEVETTAAAPERQSEIDAGGAVLADGSVLVDGSVLAVVWTRDELDPAVASALSAAVDDLTVVRRETVLLARSTAASGLPVDVVERGWSIPLDVAAVDPPGYGRVARTAGEVADLERGEGLLGETSALVRGLGVGSTLEFGDVDIVIAGVVPDEVVGAAELMVDRETGALLGVDTARYALVRSELNTADLSELLELELLPDGSPAARVRSEGEVRWLRNSDAVLPQVFIKQQFGEFAVRPAGEGFDVDPNWFADNIVSADLPGFGQLTCHERILPLLEEALAGLDQATREAVDALGFDGCWNPRAIRATGDLSRHSWGAAIDLGRLPDDPAMVRRIVDGFEAAGFTWGGDWLVPDPAHFEYVGAG